MCGQCTKEGEHYLYATFIKAKAKPSLKKVKEKNKESVITRNASVTKSEATNDFQLAANHFPFRYEHSFQSYFREITIEPSTCSSLLTNYAFTVFLSIELRDLELHLQQQCQIQTTIDRWASLPVHRAIQYFILRIFLPSETKTLPPLTPTAIEQSPPPSATIQLQSLQPPGQIDWIHVLSFLFSTLQGELVRLEHPMRTDDIDSFLRYSHRKILLIISEDAMELRTLPHYMTAILSNVFHLTVL